MTDTPTGLSSTDRPGTGAFSAAALPAGRYSEGNQVCFHLTRTFLGRLRLQGLPVEGGRHVSHNEAVAHIADCISMTLENLGHSLIV